jgi:iron complex transport system ATP-binding protein
VTIAMSPVGPSALLGVTGLRVRGGDRWILDVPHLGVAAGERVAIVGPNGAGKSTLLRSLTGVLAPTEGHVSLEGEPILRVDRRTVARTIAVVPELAQLPFEMPVHEVVALGRLPHEPPLSGLRPSDLDAVEGAIERVGIERLRERDVRDLSLGERQLVFVALAIAQDARVLVLDEPTAHLDIRHQVEVMRLLVELGERDGTTVISVLHDLALAAHFFDRVLVMDDGRIVADGPPATTLDEARIRSVFGVDPALVRLPA